MKNLFRKIVKNKKLLALIIIIAVILVIAGLYGTFASNSTVVGSADTYTITLTDETNTLIVPANSSKTVIYQVTNTNKGTVKYGVGYSGDNITVKVYNDSEDEQSGEFDYGETKFIKLLITNTANVSNEATITSVLGYENGGDLIVPSDVTLVTETYSIPTIASSKITKLFSKTGTVTNNGTTYDIDATHGLIDTSIMYKNIDGNVVVYKGDINADGKLDAEDTSILSEAYNGRTTLNTAQRLIGDIDNNNIIDSVDMTLVYAIINERTEKTYLSISAATEGASNYILDKKINQEIRYYGQNPNNYIDIGDRDSSNNPILWRIIGVFDGKLKLIRSTYITANNNTGLSWDTSATEVNSGWGINQWGESGSYEGADLMRLLNPKPDGTNYEGLNGSLYWNSQSGTCYTGSSNATTSCNFTSTGLSENVKSKIAEVTWYLGGGSSTSIYPNAAYEVERGTTVYTGIEDGITRTTSWTGKIGLAYPSDYGYATDLQECSKSLYNYSSSTNNYACRGNNWMWYTMTGAKTATSISGAKDARLLSPRSNSKVHACYVSVAGYVDGGYIYDSRTVSPVLYLSSEQVIESGSGTSTNPYILS